MGKYIDRSMTNGQTTYFWHFEYSIISGFNRSEIVVVGRWLSGWLWGCDYFDNCFINWSMGDKVVEPVKKTRSILSIM